MTEPTEPVHRAARRVRPRRRSAAAMLPASLTAAALVAAPFAGSTTGPLTAFDGTARPAYGAAAAGSGAAMPALSGAYLGIAATAAQALHRSGARGNS